MDTRTSSTPGRITPQQITRVHTAAVRAVRVHPGPVGELLARELQAYAEFGYRFGADGLLDRLAADVLATEVDTALRADPPLVLVPASQP